MRLLFISFLGVAAISVASAAAITPPNLVQLGSNSNSSGISSGGLTAAYVNQITQTAGWTGSAKSYSGVLFAADTINNSSLNGVLETTGPNAGVVAGGASTLPTSGNGFQQFTDPNNSVVFAMNTDASNANYWTSASGTLTGATSIIIPVGVLNVGMQVTQAWIMLNDYYGVLGTATQNDTVTFNFSNHAAVPVTLTNGNQIDSATHCASNSPTFITAGTNTPLVECTTYATSTSSPNTDIAWSSTTVGATPGYTNSNAGNGNTGTPFGSTTGSLSLSDINFDLSAYSAYNLTSITITDNNNGLNTSRLALSAIDVQTPEPSTVLLVLTGLGAIGFAGKRRRSRS